MKHSDEEATGHVCVWNTVREESCKDEAGERERLGQKLEGCKAHDNNNIVCSKYNRKSLSGLNRTEFQNYTL
jgi:hypothetical protein